MKPTTNSLKSKKAGIERARLLTVVSAWYTLARLEQSGISFDAFLALAASEQPEARARAEELWGDLTLRLAEVVAQELEEWPEAVLSDEVRELIEVLVVDGLKNDV